MVADTVYNYTNTVAWLEEVSTVVKCWKSILTNNFFY